MSGIEIQTENGTVTVEDDGTVTVEVSGAGWDSSVTVTVPEGATLDDVLEAARAELKAAQGAFAKMGTILNSQPAPRDTVVKQGDRVSVGPPVANG